MYEIFTSDNVTTEVKIQEKLESRQCLHQCGGKGYFGVCVCVYLRVCCLKNCSETRHGYRKEQQCLERRHQRNSHSGIRKEDIPRSHRHARTHARTRTHTQ